jgi:hypothetical protein
MADTVPPNPRAQRTRTIRRRATVAGLGVLLGAFTLVGVTTSLPAEQQASAPPVSDGAAVTATSRPRQAAPAPRRIKTRQS